MHRKETKMDTLLWIRDDDCKNSSCSYLSAYKHGKFNKAVLSCQGIQNELVLIYLSVLFIQNLERKKENMYEKRSEFVFTLWKSKYLTIKSYYNTFCQTIKPKKKYYITKYIFIETWYIKKTNCRITHSRWFYILMVYRTKHNKIYRKKNVLAFHFEINQKSN